MRFPQKFSWQALPFLRLLIPFSIGILWEEIYPVSIIRLHFLVLILLSLLLVYALLPLPSKLKWLIPAGICFQLLFLELGVLVFATNNWRNQSDWLGYRYDKKDSIRAIILEPLIAKTKTWKATVNVIAVYHRGKWITASSKIIVYIKNEKLVASLETGDSVQFSESIQPIINSSTLNGFDYARYCAFRQIYFQSYWPENSKILYKKANPSGRFYLYQARSWFLTLLRKALPQQKEQAVAEALLIGYTDDLDKNLVQSYSNTGVVHIIAISGLHLAMIYGLLLYFLKPLGNNRWVVHMRNLVVFLVLWSFSFITGGAAAILRSALGFSFLLISKSLGYKNHTLNTLAASAFLLLLYRPFLLWDIGFQLSYTAVLGIVLFSKQIEEWFRIENTLLRIFWQMNSVTLAAQVLSLPIILYQFHQFPNLFLFSNFFVVPLSGLILYAELLLIVLYPFGLLFKWTAALVQFLIAQMNGIIERTNRLPFAVTRNINFSLIDTLLLYGCIFSLISWLWYKNNKGFLSALCLLMLMFFHRWISLF